MMGSECDEHYLQAWPHRDHRGRARGVCGPGFDADAGRGLVVSKRARLARRLASGLAHRLAAILGAALGPRARLDSLALERPILGARPLGLISGFG